MACQEALSAKTERVAKDALLKLHAILVKQHKQAKEQQQQAMVDAATAAKKDGADVACTTKATSIPEAVVLRILVKITNDQVDQLASANNSTATTSNQHGSSAEDAAAQRQKDALATAFTELGSLLNTVYNRLKELGVDAFMGDKDAQVVQHLEWFAYVAWNIGLHASGKLQGSVA